MEILKDIGMLFNGYPGKVDSISSQEDEYEEIEEQEQYDEEEKQHNFMSKFMGNNKKIVSIEDRQQIPNYAASIKVRMPQSLFEAKSIVDSIRAGRIVTVDLKNVVETTDENGIVSVFEAQKEIVSFLSGAIYAVDGRAVQLSDTIFILTPATIEIDDESGIDNKKKESKFPWQ